MTTEILIAIFTALVGLLFWFLKRNFDQLDKSDMRIEGKVDKVGEKVEETRGAVIEMQDTFNRMGYPMQRILKTTSPVELTEYGKKLVEESGFNRIFSENREEILGWVKERNPKNQYDAQEISRTVLLEHQNDPIFELLKQYAFQHAETSLEQILRAGAIITRNEIIKELNLTK
jgi:hypothetical protein